MYHLAEVEPGQTVFINGGSSSLGAFSIQFAKAKGAKVIATASGKNESFVRQMGADEVCASSPPKVLSDTA
jgi:NADPH:quinone reductase-like Zn-dependent oxidoreductase